MSFDKNYQNRKDRLKPYYGSCRFDRTCRPGGSCPYCQRNRLRELDTPELGYLTGRRNRLKLLGYRYDADMHKM